MKPLSSHDLRALTNDKDSAGNRTITFMVVSSPRLGKLMRVHPDNSTEDVSVFTQDLVSPDVFLCSWAVLNVSTGQPSFIFILLS